MKLKIAIFMYLFGINFWEMKGCLLGTFIGSIIGLLVMPITWQKTLIPVIGVVVMMTVLATIMTVMEMRKGRKGRFVV